MKNLKTQMHSTMNFSSKVINEYQCFKCGNLIKVTKLVINGKTRIADWCKVCDDRQLEKEALQAYENLRDSKRERLFNEFSLISEGLKKQPLKTIILLMKLFQKRRRSL